MQRRRLIASFAGLAAGAAPRLRRQAPLSLLPWIAVIVCGRMVACF